MEREKRSNINNGVLDGTRAGVFGIVSNMLLFAGKLAVGLFSHSITVVADALNNLSDGASSVITVVGYGISARPADKKHPFGHARFEYVAALVIAVVMLVLGALFLKESLVSIFSPREVTSVGAYAYAVLGVAALVKGAQAAVYYRTYRRTRSLPMKAAAADSVLDVVTTLAALVSTLVIDLAGVNTDGYFGAAISIFIIVAAIRVLKESVSPLLGDAPLDSTVREIRERVTSYEGVLGVHDIVVHSYGAAHTFAIVHIEVSADETLTVAHDLVDKIERELSAAMGITLVAHIDPTADYAGLTTLREEIAAFLTARFPITALHDFRVVKEGDRANVYFDAEIPWEADLTAEEITAALTEGYRADLTYFVNVDKG